VHAKNSMRDAKGAARYIGRYLALQLLLNIEYISSAKKQDISMFTAIYAVMIGKPLFIK